LKLLIKKSFKKTNFIPYNFIIEIMKPTLILIVHLKKEIIQNKRKLLLYLKQKNIKNWYNISIIYNSI